MKAIPISYAVDDQTWIGPLDLLYRQLDLVIIIDAHVDNLQFHEAVSQRYGLAIEQISLGPILAYVAASKETHCQRCNKDDRKDIVE